MIPTLLLLSMLLQNPSQDELKARLEKKLQSPFLKKAAWMTDYEAALAVAAKDGKMILAYFTRSYEASEACDQVEAGFLSDPKFTGWSKGVVLLCQIATSLEGRAFDRLWTRRCSGFPSFLFLDSKGHALTTYVHSPNEVQLQFLFKDGTILHEQARMALAGVGRPEEFFESAVGVNYFNSFDEARGFYDGLKDVEGPMKDIIKGLLAALEYREIVLAIGDLRNKDKLAEAAGKCVAMARGGRVPGIQPEKKSFWRGVVEGAETAGDSDLMGKALNEAKGYADTKQEWVKTKEAALQKLKEKKK